MATDAVGRPVSMSAFKTAFRAFCAAHDFAITFHALRHSNAIAMLVGGVDVKTASGRLGHANPALLFKTYSHYIRSADRAAAEQLDRVFR